VKNGRRSWYLESSISERSMLSSAFFFCFGGIGVCCYLRRSDFLESLSSSDKIFLEKKKVSSGSSSVGREEPREKSMPVWSMFDWRPL